MYSTDCKYFKTKWNIGCRINFILIYRKKNITITKIKNGNILRRTAKTIERHFIRKLIFQNNRRK